MRRRLCRRCGRIIDGGHSSVNPCPVTDDMLAALKTFAEDRGKTWKSQLSDAWGRGKDLGPDLQMVRNVVGPTALQKIDLR
jgi:hypothetical protein